MPSDHSFRLSTYLSLMLASACLGYAEVDLLPGGAAIAGLTVALLAVALRLEGRFELGLAAANRLGVVLFVAAGVWLVTQFADRGSLLYTVPWPAGLLPYVGTMLLMAMPAKLLRPKHAGDWWTLQGMGLAAVALACALTEDAGFGLLLVSYAVTAVGGLALFHLKREAGQVPPTPPDPWLGLAFGRPRDALPPAVVASAPTRVRGAWRPAVGWLSVALAVALPLFFLTPRLGTARWNLSGAALETGYDSPQMTDLNRTGELRVNTEEAFEVRVTGADGRPVDDLTAGQRWRGVALNEYKGGKWQGPAGSRLIARGSLAVPDQTRMAAQTAPPGLRVAVYTLRAGTSEPPVADPVRWRPGGGAPLWSAPRAGQGGPGTPWFQKPDAAFNAQQTSQPAGEPYRQYLYPPVAGDPDLGTGFRLDDPDGDPGRGGLRAVPGTLTELPARTRDLLDRLAAGGTLPARVTASAWFRREGTPDPADWEAVARAFQGQFATGYEYTLNLTRRDRRADPIEEFLYRTKAGNCERFAAGLALMCRAVGVPARYVLGFKGHEPLGDGRYVVRQDHAHAWVEVLVPRGDGDDRRWHWLSLDPTPDASNADAEPDSLLGAAAKNGRSFFGRFIVGYNADSRRKAAEAAHTLMTGPEFVLGFGGLLVAIGLGAVVWRTCRWVRRRRAVVAVPAGWYDQLVTILTRAGHPPPGGATPAEYARAAGRRLTARAATVDVAGVPMALADLLYAERFAGRPAGPDAQARIEAELDRLAKALGS